MQTIGYARASAFVVDIAEQVTALESAGCSEIVIDRGRGRHPRDLKKRSALLSRLETSEGKVFRPSAAHPLTASKATQKARGRGGGSCAVFGVTRRGSHEARYEGSAGVTGSIRHAGPGCRCGWGAGALPKRP